jgi:hypothetical protein
VQVARDKNLVTVRVQVRDVTSTILGDTLHVDDAASPGYFFFDFI